MNDEQLKHIELSSTNIFGVLSRHDHYTHIFSQKLTSFQLCWYVIGLLSRNNKPQTTLGMESGADVTRRFLRGASMFGDIPKNSCEGDYRQH